jgi:hypothetical protein
MMRLSFVVYVFAVMTAVLASSAGQAYATDTSKDWPCVQRKVQEVALATVWSGTSVDLQAENWRSDPEIAGLVERLTARRTSEDEARTAIAALAASAGGQKRDKLLGLLAGLVDRINAERAEVIAGIERRGHAQKQFAEKLRAETAEFDALSADPKADRAKIAEMRDALNWDLRVFDDRQKSLRFVCEVPALIEQRLFMLARAIENTLQ